MVTVALGVLAEPMSAQDGLRSASLPERTPATPTSETAVDLFRAGPDTYRPHPRPTPHGSDARWTQGYLGPVYGGTTLPMSSPAPATPTPYVERGGYLRLHARPRTSQVFIDGYYAGTVEDFAEGRGLLLAPGPHRVELRSTGFQSATFDVRVVSDGTISYGQDLAPRQDAPAPVTVAPALKPFYVIPGCYAGDSVPDAGRLPNGCDVAKVRVVAPSAQ